MTLLGSTDGDDAHTGASYLELAEFIMRQGALPNEDLAQLWRRIVFHICISNTDDHLRNHGFLLTPEGWNLSPAYDLNPEPDGRGLCMNIDEHDNALSLELAIAAAPYYRVGPNAAAMARHMARTVTKHWRVLAGAVGLSRGAMERMEPAFAEKP
jgi:serine/threonine-protein kinase HipA